MWDRCGERALSEWMAGARDRDTRDSRDGSDSSNNSNGSDSDGSGGDRLRALYPNVNEQETPLPRAWSTKDKYNYIGLSQNNLRVHYKGTFVSDVIRVIDRRKQRDQLIGGERTKDGARGGEGGAGRSPKAAGGRGGRAGSVHPSPVGGHVRSTLRNIARRKRRRTRPFTDRSLLSGASDSNVAYDT